MYFSRCSLNASCYAITARRSVRVSALGRRATVVRDLGRSRRGISADHRLVRRGHLLEERLDRVARVAAGHRLREVDHVCQQQVLPRRLAHLARLPLRLQVDAVEEVVAGGVLGEELRVLEDVLLRLVVLLVDRRVLVERALRLREELVVPIHELRLVRRANLELVVLLRLCAPGGELARGGEARRGEGGAGAHLRISR